MNIVCKKPYLISGLREAFPEDQILEENLEQADILISEPKNLHLQLLELMPALKLVLGSRAGYDVADLGYLKSRGIAFCNARGLYSVPIAEDIVCKILTFSTNAWLYTEQKARRIYQATAERRCLSSLTIGFLGTGSIASEAAKRLDRFGCRVIGYKHKKVDTLPWFHALYYGETGLKTVLEQSDVVVVAVDLNAGTKHLLNAQTIQWMRKGSALINIARGGVVEEAALIQALRSGKLGYAGLDVFETEPLPADSPLWNLPQAVITPHAAGLCYENHAMLEQLVIENIQNYKAGRPLHNQIL